MMIWVALVTVYVIWGSTYLAIRVTVETLPPFTPAAARFGLAGLLLAAVLLVRRGPRALVVSGRQLAGSALGGLLLLAGGNGLVVLAEDGPPGYAVPSGVAALLIATVPLLLVLWGTLTGQRPARATVLGVAIGFAGLAVLVLPGSDASGAPPARSLMVVGAAVAWSLGSFVPRWLPVPADPFVGSVYQMTAGALALLAIGAARGELTGFAPGSVSGRSWVALVYLMLAGSLVAFTAYIWLLHHASISLVSTYAYVNPVVAVVLGALVVAEPVTWPVLVGGGIVVFGVAVVVSTERRRTRGSG
jgi:drug/metabolite transporter (DMT)-like permease